MNMFIIMILSFEILFKFKLYNFLFHFFSVADWIFNKHLQYLQVKRFASAVSDNDCLNSLN